MSNWATNLIGLLGMAVLTNASQGTAVANEYWIDIQVDPNDDDYALFTLQMPLGDKWFGIGFGSDMTQGNDLYMIEGNNGQVVDMVSTGNAAPL